MDNPSPKQVQISQIKVRQGNSDGPPREKESAVGDIIRAANSEAKQNTNVTPSPHHRKSSDGVFRASDTAAIDTGSPISSVRDAVSKFGGATNWKANKVQTPTMEVT